MFDEPDAAYFGGGKVLEHDAIIPTVNKLVLTLLNCHWSTGEDRWGGGFLARGEVLLHFYTSTVTTHRLGL